MEIEQEFHVHPKAQSSFKKGIHESNKSIQNRKSGSYRPLLFRQREKHTPKAPIKTKKVMNVKQRKKIFGLNPSETIDKACCSGDSIPLLPSPNAAEKSKNLTHEDIRDDCETMITSSMSSRSLDFSDSKKDRFREEEFIRLETWVNTPETRRNPSDAIDFHNYSCATPLTSHVSSILQEMRLAKGVPESTVYTDLRANSYNGSPSLSKKIQEELSDILFIENSNSSHPIAGTNIAIQENSKTAKMIIVKINNPGTAKAKTVDTRSGVLKEPVSYSSSKKGEGAPTMSCGSSDMDKTEKSMLSFFSYATNRLHQTLLECCAPSIQSPPTVSHINSFHRLTTKDYITQDFMTSSKSVDE